MSDTTDLKTVFVKTEVAYGIQTMQQAHDCGVNSFAVQLLAESLGDKDMVLDHGIIFLFPHDHKKRPIWIIVTGVEPTIEQRAEQTEEPFEFNWFRDSPNVGDPTCRCSHCGNLIPEEDAEGEAIVPFRLFMDSDSLEARFCPDCRPKAVRWFASARRKHISGQN